jgi:hypothetical protein
LVTPARCAMSVMVGRFIRVPSLQANPRPPVVTGDRP